MAPELEKGLGYDERVDIYSLGLIYYELIKKFSTDHERYIHLNQLHQEERIKDEQLIREMPEECEIINRMIAKDPIKRLKSKEIKETTYYQNLLSNFNSK